MSEVTLPVHAPHACSSQPTRTLGALGQLVSPIGSLFGLGRTADRVLQHVHVAEGSLLAAGQVAPPPGPARTGSTEPHTVDAIAPHRSAPRPVTRDAERWAAALLTQLEWDTRRR